MADAVALLGLALFWASLFWMPLAAARAVMNRGGAQTWSIAALLTFGMAFMGFTRAVAMGSTAEAFSWSVSWAMPVGLAIFARAAPGAVWRNADRWVGAAAALSFILVLPALPWFFVTAAGLIWTRSP